VGRAFSGAAVELALAGYPGFAMTSPPGKGGPYGVYTPEFVSNGEVEQVAVLPDGTRRRIAPAPVTSSSPASVSRASAEPVERPSPVGGRVVRVPLGRVAGARSGDKGGDANIGVWARTDEQWSWLEGYLTVERFGALLPETRDLAVTRHLLPNLRAMNFVVEGLLQEGVSASTRFDPQGKALGEWLRSRLVDVPKEIL